MPKIFFLLSLIFYCSFNGTAAEIPPQLKEIGITEHLGQVVTLNDLTFRNEQGESVKLARYFEKKKPVLLVLVYYQCPNLCGLVFNGLLTSLKEFKWTAGKEFEIVTVSIDPREGPELSRSKKETLISAYGRKEAEAGWHFLTGEESQIKNLASQVGFGYRYIDQEKQFAHSAALFVLTPLGKISRYLYGVQFAEKDLRLALLEASEGRVGTVIDRFLLFCYRYDPQSRSYSLVLTRVMQAAAGGTVLMTGLVFGFVWNRERRKLRGSGLG